MRLTLDHILCIELNDVQSLSRIEPIRVRTFCPSVIDIADVLAQHMIVRLDHFVRIMRADTRTGFLEGAHLWGSTIATCVRSASIDAAMRLSLQHRCRQLARLIWFHVPVYSKTPLEGDEPGEEERVRVLIEKKTMLNVIEAFAVALKHCASSLSCFEYRCRY